MVESGFIISIRNVFFFIIKVRLSLTEESAYESCRLKEISLHQNFEIFNLIFLIVNVLYLLKKGEASINILVINNFEYQKKKFYI